MERPSSASNWLPDDLAEALAQGLGLLAELLAGLAAAVREGEQAVAREHGPRDL